MIAFRRGGKPQVGGFVKVNLESLRTEIEQYLADNNLVLFRSHPRLPSSSSGAVFWDTDHYPDFKQFIDTAIATGTSLVSLHATIFSDLDIEDLADQLEEAGLDPSERRQMETRLKELDAYTGFVCQIEISFDHGSRSYIYELLTDWYEDFQDLSDQLEESLDGMNRDTPLSSYYSSNN